MEFNNLILIIVNIILSIIIYDLCTKLYKKTKSPFLNPVLICAIVIILLLLLFRIPYNTYKIGGNFINEFLGILIVVLAIPLYKSRQTLSENFGAILGGIIAGIITSFVAVTILCKIFNLDIISYISLIPKSITTPMAIEAVQLLAGNKVITVLAVVITGISGAITGPIIIKIMKIKNDTAKGIGMGNASHAIGTMKSMEISEKAGAASSFAMSATGIITLLAVIISANLFV